MGRGQPHRAYRACGNHRRASPPGETWPCRGRLMSTRFGGSLNPPTPGPHDRSRLRHSHVGNARDLEARLGTGKSLEQAASDAGISLAQAIATLKASGLAFIDGEL